MNHFEIKAWDNGGQMEFREIRKPTTIKRNERFTIKQQEFPIFIFNWYYALYVFKRFWTNQV
jgi:hypothetical protein